MSGVQNRGGAIYFSLALFAFTSLTTTDLLMAERRLVWREARGKRGAAARLRVELLASVYRARSWGWPAHVSVLVSPCLAPQPAT